MSIEFISECGIGTGIRDKELLTLAEELAVQDVSGIDESKVALKQQQLNITMVLGIALSKETAEALQWRISF